MVWFGNSEIQGFRDSGFEHFRIPEVLILRFSKFPNFRIFEVHIFKIQISKFRFSGFSLLRYSTFIIDIQYFYLTFTFTTEDLN